MWYQWKNILMIFTKGVAGQRNSHYMLVFKFNNNIPLFPLPKPLYLNRIKWLIWCGGFSSKVGEGVFLICNSLLWSQNVSQLDFGWLRHWEWIVGNHFSLCRGPWCTWNDVDRGNIINTFFTLAGLCGPPPI